MQWSPSALNDFIKCPLAYWFKYAQGWRQTPNEALATGTLVHGVLEEFLALEPDDRDRDAARDLFNARFEEFSATPPSGVDPSDVRSLAGAAMGRYFDMEDPRLVEVIPGGLERAVSATLGGVATRGSIDRVEFGIEGTRVVDYKTGAAKPAYAAAYWRQQLLYAAMMNDEGNTVTEVSLMYLGAMPRQMTRPTPGSALRRVEHDLVTASDQRAGYDEVSTWEARESALCRFCPFRRACPLMSNRAPVPGSSDSDQRLSSVSNLRRSTQPPPSDRDDVGDPEVTA